METHRFGRPEIGPNPSTLRAEERLSGFEPPGGKRRRPNPVIFDSSFLMAVSEKPTRWFEDITDAIGRFDPVLPECVIEELEKLATRQSSKSRVARVALELGQTFDKVPCGGARVDDEIASLALGMGAKVATTDSTLVKSLRSLHVGVILLRSGRVSVDRGILKRPG